MEASRKQRERTFFNEWAAWGNCPAVDKYRTIAGGTGRCYEERILEDCRNKDALEYGCGVGLDALALARQGAKVVAIDISDVGIRAARRRAAEQSLGGTIKFSMADCESLCFADGSFDLVCGNAILHHLDIDKALSEIVRVLKPQGRAVFLEPLGHNPAINLFRKLTPQFRTEDEHPLRRSDLKLIKKFFHEVQYEFFCLSSILAVPLRNSRAFAPLLKSLELLDKVLFAAVPPLRLWAWLVVLTCKGPEASGGE